MLRKSLKEIGSKSSFAKFAEDNIVNKSAYFDEKKKVGFSEEIHRIHEVSDMQKNKNSSNKDLFSPSFSNGPIQDKPVIESKFAALGKNLILKQQNINERNDIMRNERQNTTNHLDFDVNEYIQKKTKGLENKKKLMSNFEKIQEEQPKLIPLQSFTSKHLQELMVPVVNAVQGTMVKMKKLDEKIEKKEVEKKNTIEKIMNKQNEIISFMMNKNEDKKEKRIKLKYKELQQELDKVELGLSPDYTKFNFLQEELNYFLNKEAEIETIKTYERLLKQYNEYLTKYSGPALWYNQMIENYKKTMKFLDTINPYKYLEARNKNRLQQLNQKKQELLDRESEENLKGFIIANKLKKRYENNLREILQKDEDGSKPPEDLKEEDEKSKFTEVKSNDKKIEENEPSTKKKKHKKEKENKKKKKKLLIIEK